MIDHIPQMLLIVASYLAVAALAAWFGFKAGAELMRRYWEGK